MADYTHIEVEPNANCPMSANLVFKNLSEPFRVARVRIFEGGEESRLCEVTGWSSVRFYPIGGPGKARWAPPVMHQRSYEKISG